MVGVDPDDGYTAAPGDGVDIWNSILNPNAVCSVLQSRNPCSCCNPLLTCLATRSRLAMSCLKSCQKYLILSQLYLVFSYLVLSCLTPCLQSRPATRWHAAGGPGPDEMIYCLESATSGAYRNGSYKVILGSAKKRYVLVWLYMCMRRWLLWCDDYCHGLTLRATCVVRMAGWHNIQGPRLISQLLAQPVGTPLACLMWKTTSAR
jgi:hypothetical protein